jgi:transposase
MKISVVSGDEVAVTVEQWKPSVCLARNAAFAAMSAYQPPAKGRGSARECLILCAFFAAPPQEDGMNSAYRSVAAIDVHKKWLYVVVGRPEAAEREFTRCRTGSTTPELARLADWLHQQGVSTVVMESTAQYGKPVWAALEQEFTLLLAQARSNAAVRGRKSDYADALRLVKRLWAEDLRLSFVPDAETDPQALAALADRRLRATRAELEQALDGRLGAVPRLLLGQLLEQIEVLESHMTHIDQCLLHQLEGQREVIRRLCAVPGIGIESAQTIVAELGPQAAAFPTAAQAASWVGVCPGRNESAGHSVSDASPKGNRAMRRVLNQCAWAAVRTKDTYWQHLFRRLTAKIGVNRALWAVAHRMLRLVWMILHDGIEYQELGPCGPDPDRMRRRIERMLTELRKRGIHFQLTPVPQP